MTSLPTAPQNTFSRSPSSDSIFDVFKAEPPVCDAKNSHLDNVDGKSINESHFEFWQRIAFPTQIFTFHWHFLALKPTFPMKIHPNHSAQIHIRTIFLGISLCNMWNPAKHYRMRSILATCWFKTFRQHVILFIRIHKVCDNGEKHNTAQLLQSVCFIFSHLIALRSQMSKCHCLCSRVEFSLNFLTVGWDFALM